MVISRSGIGSGADPFRKRGTEGMPSILSVLAAA
jgi:hypothetical protein